VLYAPPFASGAPAATAGASAPEHGGRLRSERLNDGAEASARNRLGRLACAARVVNGAACGVPPIVATKHAA
jgi:hypothetical protein